MADRGSAVSNEISPKKEFFPSRASSLGCSVGSFVFVFLYRQRTIIEWPKKEADYGGATYRDTNEALFEDEKRITDVVLLNDFVTFLKIYFLHASGSSLDRALR